MRILQDLILTNTALQGDLSIFKFFPFLQTLFPAGSAVEGDFGQLESLKEAHASGLPQGHVESSMNRWYVGHVKRV